MTIVVVVGDLSIVVAVADEKDNKRNNNNDKNDNDNGNIHIDNADKHHNGNIRNTVIIYVNCN